MNRIHHLPNFSRFLLKIPGRALLSCGLFVGTCAIISSLYCDRAFAGTVIGQSAQLPAHIERYRFDVVSIKPSRPGTPTSVHPTLDGYSAKSMTARALLCAGYDLRMCDLLSGLPGWADSSRFDVEAKMDADAATAFQKLSENEKLAQLRLMLQELLTDRFRLIAHHSAKDSPVYFLVSTKGGGKLKAAAPVETTLMMVGPAGITATATTIEDLIETLSDNVGRVIVDRTGLNGRYDFVLKTAEDQGAGNADSEPSIFTALQEQLGLKLLPGKAAVDTVVVDHIEKPYTN